MQRRSFLQAGLGLALGTKLFGAVQQDKLESAADVLTAATKSGQVDAASLYIQTGDRTFARSFGTSKSVDDMFLLASISKTISAAAVMTLYDQGKLDLDDPATKYIPEFSGEGREKITVRQLLTHVSGLPDQLPENAKLRSSHSPLSAFVDAAIRTPLLFPPGMRYSYSSMAILLATEVAQRISGKSIAALTEESIYKPLKMTRSAMGLGRFKLSDVVLNQVEYGAPESGAGDPATKSWDWNSPYWRKLGAPWGAAHGSASDMGNFLREFLHSGGKALKPDTAKLMISNHNPEGIRARGLGFDLGQQIGGPGCSERTFGHTGSTGTRCWADPETETICVVLTTLPARAVSPHPRDLTSDAVAKAVAPSR